MIKTAEISECGMYRYTLTREWDSIYTARLCIVMLNPSTADADNDDPTIRRCVGFAKREGYGSIVVVNVAAYRATKSADMLAANNPVGPHNDVSVWLAAMQSEAVLVAWGAKAPRRLVTRAVKQLHIEHATLWCLGTTKAGHPRHPLYVRGDQPLVPWVMP